MGELSRFKGFVGENIAEQLLDNIGWGYMSNLEFSCVAKSKHEKRTHDMDLVSVYLSPTEVDVLEIILISVKYVSYKNLKANFKQYVDSLISAADCFQHSEQYSEVISGIRYKRKRHNLLLFWIDSEKEMSFNISKELKGLELDNLTDYDFLHILDNYRVNFLHESIKLVINIYPHNKKEFYYHPTGLSERIDGGRQISGSLLPVDYLTSDILLFKIVDEKILVICVNETFDKDVFKRVLGLSQNLTSGWCKRIIIAFPDYNLLKHKNIKQSVLMKFQDKEFSNMVEVIDMKRDFFSLEAKELMNEIGSPTHNPNFNIETMLPYGDQIRQLLNYSYISKNDLVRLLNSRGVYVRRQLTKEEVTPFFAKTIISPIEFEYLRRKQSAKEDNEKISTKYLYNDVTKDVNDALNIVLPSIKLELSRKLPNCELINDLKVNRKANGDLLVAFETNKYNLNKDWTSMSSLEKGEVVFGSREINGEKKTQIDSSYTSSETKKMASIVVKEVVNHLKKLSIIPIEEKPLKFLSGDFSKTQRNNFLISFIEDTPKDIALEFKQLVGVDFSIDEEADGLPEELSSLCNKVDESVFTGRNLEQIRYLTDQRYRDSLLFYSFTAEFYFQYDILGNNFEGKAEIEFGFLDSKNKSRDSMDRSEFEYKVKNVNPFVKYNLSQKEYHSITLRLKEDFDKIKVLNVEK